MSLSIVESRRGAVTWAVRQRSVSSPRSSNRTCRFPASGFPTDFIVRLTAVAAGLPGGLAQPQGARHRKPTHQPRVPATVLAGRHLGDEVPPNAVGPSWAISGSGRGALGGRRNLNGTGGQ